MLQAAIRAETEYTNIRTIASEALGAGQAFSAQVNASQAEKTISQYKSGDDGSDKSGSTAAAPFVAMDVVDLTRGPLSRTAFMSSSAPTRATQGFKRMQRKRLNESATSGRRSSRTPRSARI